MTGQPNQGIQLVKDPQNQDEVPRPHVGTTDSSESLHDLHSFGRRSWIGQAVTGLVLGSLGVQHSLPAQDKVTADKMPHNPRLFSFVGGSTGPWKTSASHNITGEGLPAIDRLQLLAGNVTPIPADAEWVLHGVTSNERYVIRPEKQSLLAKQPALGRPEADCAVRIPIRKSAAWWALTQDERRQIFEETSHHN